MHQRASQSALWSAGHCIRQLGLSAMAYAGTEKGHCRAHNIRPWASVVKSGSVPHQAGLPAFWIFSQLHSPPLTFVTARMGNRVLGGSRWEPRKSFRGHSFGIRSGSAEAYLIGCTLSEIILITEGQVALRRLGTDAPGGTC